MNQKTRRNRQRRNTIRRRKNKRRQRKTRVKGGASFFSGYKPLNDDRVDSNEMSHQVAMYEATQAKKIADNLRIQADEAQKIADEAQEIADEAQREEAQRQAQRESYTMFPNNPPIKANNFITTKPYIPLNINKLNEERRRRANKLNEERRRREISAMEGKVFES